MRHHFSDSHRIGRIALALDLWWTRCMAIMFAEFRERAWLTRARRAHLQQQGKWQGLHKGCFAPRWNIEYPCAAILAAQQGGQFRDSLAIGDADLCGQAQLSDF